MDNIKKLVLVRKKKYQILNEYNHDSYFSSFFWFLISFKGAAMPKFDLFSHELF